MSQEGIQLHADFSNSFRNRYLIVGIVLTGFTFWCLYDGLVTYPKQREQTQEPWDKYQEIVEEITTKPNTEQPPETAIQEQDIKKRWEAIANEKGWSTELPPEEPKTDNDITVQYIMAAITGCLALPFLVSYFRSRGQWVELDDDGIRTSRGQEFRLNQITVIDKRKWKNKGIAVISYLKPEDGRERKFVLDAFKFQATPTDQMMEVIDGKIAERLAAEEDSSSET